MASFLNYGFPIMYPVATNGMAENCRQVAHSQDSQMNGSWTQVPNGLTPAPPQWYQQNGQTLNMSEQQRPTAFTNGRKRSRENIECEELKKAKTEIGHHYNHAVEMPMNQMMAFQNGAYVQSGQETPLPQMYHQPHIGSCFKSSFIEHQSLMYAERNYDISLMSALVSEAHGC